MEAWISSALQIRRDLLTNIRATERGVIYFLLDCRESRGRLYMLIIDGMHAASGLLLD